MKTRQRKRVALRTGTTFLALATGMTASVSLFGATAQATAQTAGLPVSAPRAGLLTYGLSDQGILSVDPATGAYKSGPYLPKLAGLRLGEPDWSPDGNRLALVIVNADNTRGLVTYTVGDQNVQIVENPVPGGAYHPSWTKDGKSIVFQGYSGALHNGPSQIMVIDPTPGSTEKPYLPLEGNCPEIDPQTGPDGGVVFTRTPVLECSGGNGVAYSHNGVTHVFGQVQDWSPALSPDGGTIAWVHNLGTTPSTYQIWTAPTSGGTGVPLPGGPSGTDVIRDLVYSPDGKYLTYTVAAQSGGRREIIPATGGTPVNLGGVAVAGSRMSWQPVFNKNIVRLAGDSRIGTAVSASRFEWADHGVADPARRPAAAAVISRSDNYADALGGAVLAARVGGPLLLTSTGALDPAVTGELSRILAPGAPVYLLGGPAALSPTVEQQAGAHWSAKRVAGVDRFATAVEIARRALALTPPSTPSDPTHILVATGLDFPDALSAGAAAGALGNGVVVLSNGDVLPDATRAFLADPTGTGAQVEVDTVGGQAGKAVPEYVPSVKLPRNSYVRAFSGQDRYDTSYKVANGLVGLRIQPVSAGIVTGANWPDALAGGALLATLHGPLLLYPPTATTPTTAADPWLRRNAANLRTVLIFGGLGALPAAIPNLIAGDIASPGQSTYTENPF
ncbi:MAG: cell wall-binding repeat-containing protein [Catenulispora sp.]|nr:cell wall-binding repeat-containing protein [Catenulispora sp.]